MKVIELLYVLYDMPLMSDVKVQNRNITQMEVLDIGLSRNSNDVNLYIGTNKEKRETGIEAVPHNISNL